MKMKAIRGWRRTLPDGWEVTIPDDEEGELVELEGVSIPRAVSVTHPGKGRRPVALRMRLEVRDGVPRCTEVVLTGDDVRRTDLQSVPVEDVIEAALVATPEPIDADVMAAWFEEFDAGVIDEGEVRARLDAWFDEHVGPGRRRLIRSARAQSRRKITDEMLREVASIYRTHIGQAPTAAVAEHFGVSQRTASGYATRARKAGLLEDVDRGGRPSESQT